MQRFTPSSIWTHDPLIAIPTLYPLRHRVIMLHWLAYIYYAAEILFRLSENMGHEMTDQTARRQ